MSILNTAILIVGLIALSLTIPALIYIISTFRRRTIAMKKLDYLIEDVTYKSEMLNSTVETVAKIANYVDAFEVITRKNVKSAAKIISRNKEDIYKIGNRIKSAALGDNQPKSRSKKKGSK